MERRFLKIIVFTGLLITSCQQIPINESNKNFVDDNIEKQNLVIDLKKQEKIISYHSDIWSYILVNSTHTSDTLDEQTLMYMNRHLQDLDKFKEFLNDSYYFIFFVIEELENAKLPIELAFLPYIESNYDPFSISSSGAVGMWQFMPRTGRTYDLDRSWWNEDRHDPFKSTTAAIKYLKYLYERFDQDLYLTLAAYNAGTSFLGQVEILTLSEYLNIKPELLYKLNAGYTKWASAPSEKSVFYIPIEQYDFFQTTENPFSDSNQINWISHTVESGDSLWSLARKYDTEVRIIREINFLENDLLSINTTLLIPLSKTESNNFIPYEMHIVSEGDSLWRLAKKYNLEVIDIARMNNIDVNSYLQLGQQLTIGNKNIHRNMESKKRTILYSVKQGDNLYKISELFDVSVKSIKDINKFKEETLRPGQIIKVAIKAF